MKSPIENPYCYGHEAVEEQLVKLIRQQRLPHAILLTGPKGIGKATLAFRLARYVLTGYEPEPPTMGLFGEEPNPEATTLAMPMDDNPAIQRMINGSHGDLLVVQPEFDEKKKTSADTVFIDAIRKVTDFMHHTPSESKWRVVVIDPAEAMNTNAANALLKVLEEPPAQTLLILISHQPGRLLPTIRSRCRHFALNAPQESVVQQIFDRQGQGIGADDLSHLLPLAQGAPGQALMLHRHDGLAIYQRYLDVLAQPQPQAIQSLAGEVAKASAEEWLIYKALLLQLLYRLCLYGGATEIMTPITGEQPVFQALLQRQPLAHWLELWEKAETSLAEVNTLTMDKKQVMLSLFFMAGEMRRAA